MLKIEVFCDVCGELIKLERIYNFQTIDDCTIRIQHKPAEPASRHACSLTCVAKMLERIFTKRGESATSSGI